MVIENGQVPSMLFAGYQISNGFKLLYLSFIEFWSWIQLVLLGYISDCLWNCTTFNLNYGTEKDIKVHINKTERSTGAIPVPCILLDSSLTLFEIFSSYYPGLLHIFKDVRLVIICQTVDELTNWIFKTTAAKIFKYARNGNPWGIGVRKDMNR